MAFFRLIDQQRDLTLMPTEHAASGWGPSLRGRAVSGVLARQTERTATQEQFEGMRPSRWTLELLRPAFGYETRVTAQVARRGRRAAVIDAEFWQQEKLVARSSTLYTRIEESPGEEIWESAYQREAPPSSIELNEEDYWVAGSVKQGWAEQHNAISGGEQKMIWIHAKTIIEDEDPTPFQFLASAADLASLATNWGSKGIQYINADLTVHFSRLPVSGEIGMFAIDRSAHSGVAVGTVSIWDRKGQLGSASTTALANPNAIVKVGEWSSRTSAD